MQLRVLNTRRIKRLVGRFLTRQRYNGEEISKISLEEFLSYRGINYFWNETVMTANYRILNVLFERMAFKGGGGGRGGRISMFTVKFDIDGNVKGKYEREILTKRKKLRNDHRQVSNIFIIKFFLARKPICCTHVRRRN